MPTFREATSFASFGALSLFFDADSLCNTIGGNALVLYHGHHFVHRIAGFEFGDHLLDETTVSNVNLLYEASDLLITDYSSCMFDYMIVHKPFVCYAPDYDSFARSRPMLFDMEKEVPGGVQRDEASLRARVKTLIAHPENESFDDFWRRFISRGPNATDVIISKMISDGALITQEKGKVAI
jgi:Putative glycosyl/glycerophosphate transferases involved in teichoic acid biosynthesis TagF/TagB/EpsJ/RodC